jgi:hypothetical protein
MLIAVIFLFCVVPAFPQAGDGKAGIGKATELVKGYLKVELSCYMLLEL